MAMGWNRAFTGIKKIGGAMRNAISVNTANAQNVLKRARNYVSVSRVGKKLGLNLPAINRHQNLRRLRKTVASRVPDAQLASDPLVTVKSQHERTPEIVRRLEEAIGEERAAGSYFGQAQVDMAARIFARDNVSATFNTGIRISKAGIRDVSKRYGETVGETSGLVVGHETTHALLENLVPERFGVQANRSGATKRLLSKFGIGDWGAVYPEGSTTLFHQGLISTLDLPTIPRLQAERFGEVAKEHFPTALVGLQRFGKQFGVQSLADMNMKGFKQMIRQAGFDYSKMKNINVLKEHLPL